MNVTRVHSTTAFVVSFPFAGCNNDDNGNATPSPGGSS